MLDFGILRAWVRPGVAGRWHFWRGWSFLAWHWAGGGVGGGASRGGGLSAGWVLVVSGSSVWSGSVVPVGIDDVNICTILSGTRSSTDLGQSTCIVVDCMTNPGLGQLVLVLDWCRAGAVLVHVLACSGGASSPWLGPWSSWPGWSVCPLA